MQKLVFATTNAVLAHAGRRFRIRAGEIWASDDPLVAHYPSMFTDQPRAVRCTTTTAGYKEVPVEQPVEQATAAPGEKRNTVRPDKARALDRAQRLGVQVDARWSAAKIDTACDEFEAQQVVEGNQAE